MDIDPVKAASPVTFGANDFNHPEHCMHDHVPLTLAAILLAGIGAQWLAWWLRLPAILPLLAVGLIAGPVTGWLDPDALFGHLLFPMVSLGVAVILFEGALTLRFAEIRSQVRVVRNLVSFGALTNWLIIARGARRAGAAVRRAGHGQARAGVRPEREWHILRWKAS